MNARLEELPPEGCLDEVASLGVRLQECLDLFRAQVNIVVLDNRAGKVKTVMQPIVGKDLQALSFIHVGDHSAAREGVDDAFHLVRSLHPDPVGQLLLGADVVGDIGRQVSRGVDGIIVRRERLCPMQLSFGLKQVSYVLLLEGQGFG